MSFMNKILKHLFTIKFELKQSFLLGVLYDDFSKSMAGHLLLANAVLLHHENMKLCLEREQGEWELWLLPPEIA